MKSLNVLISFKNAPFALSSLMARSKSNRYRLSSRDDMTKIICHLTFVNLYLSHGKKEYFNAHNITEFVLQKQLLN